MPSAKGITAASGSGWMSVPVEQTIGGAHVAVAVDAADDRGLVDQPARHARDDQRAKRDSHRDRRCGRATVRAPGDPACARPPSSAAATSGRDSARTLTDAPRMEKCSGPNVAAASASPTASAAVTSAAMVRRLTGRPRAGRASLHRTRCRGPRTTACRSKRNPRASSRRARSRVRGVGAGADRRHLQRVEAVARRPPARSPVRSPVQPRVGNAVEQLEFGRIAEIPEPAKADRARDRPPRARATVRTARWQTARSSWR